MEITAKQPDEKQYPAHFGQYIQLVEEGPIRERLIIQLEETKAKLEALNAHQWEHRYAPGKWTIKEVIGHIIDTEQIMCYRMLCIARGDQTSLPPFDENDYANFADYSRWEAADIMDQYVTVRRYTLGLIKHFTETEWKRMGGVSQHPISSLALAYIIAGHELHHWNIMNERYL